MGRDLVGEGGGCVGVVTGGGCKGISGKKGLSVGEPGCGKGERE